MTMAAKPAWAGREMRLDPFRLPQVTSYATCDDRSGATFKIEPRGVVIRRVLRQSGIPMSMVVPARVYRGVAARAIQDEDESITVTLELLHDDPDLSVPLLVATDLDDIAADWRAWAECFSLPMLLFEDDGIARSLEESLGQVEVRPPQERRQGKAARQRRPRFLARRKTGNLGLRLVVEGEEIIARG